MKFIRPGFVLLLGSFAVSACGQSDAWKKSPGMTLHFECIAPGADFDAVVKAVGGRLRDVHALVSKEGADRLAVWIPYSPAHQKAHDDFVAAKQAIVRVSPGDAELRTLVGLPAAQRDAGWDGIAAPGSVERAHLAALGAATDAEAKAKAREAEFKPVDIPADVLETAAQAREASRQAWETASKDYVTADNILELIDGSLEPGAVDADQSLRDIAVRHPLQAPAIQAARAAAQRLHDVARDEPEPEEIEAMLTLHGNLEFRIAIQPSDIAGGRAGDAYRAAVESLFNHGPEQPLVVDTSDGAAKMRWFVIDENSGDNFRGGDYAVVEYMAGQYVLCYDDSVVSGSAPHTLTHSDPGRKPWMVDAGSPMLDPSSGGVMLPFNLDPVGARYMGELTEANLHHAMAILVDAKAMSAPNINGRITDAGVVTFGRATPSRSETSILKEAKKLKRELDAASMPLVLKRVP